MNASENQAVTLRNPMRTLCRVWLDRVACVLFGLLAIVGLFLPEICVLRCPDGAATVFLGVIVDPPTGEPTVSTVYSWWPLVLLFTVGSFYYLVRAVRPNHPAN